MNKLACLALLLVASATAAAQTPDIDPGLWEMQNHIKGGTAMAGMLGQLDQLPPEMRDMVNQRLGASGVSLGAAGDGGVDMTVRTCLTPADLKGGLIQQGRKQGDCTYTTVTRVGNTWKGQMVCDGKFSGTGDFVTTLHDRRHYSTIATIESPITGRLNLQMESRRVSPNCNTAEAAPNQPSPPLPPQAP